MNKKYCIKKVIIRENQSIMFKPRKNARRSIVSDMDLEKGTILDSSHITCKRPGKGISPMFWNKVLGRKLKKSLKADQVLKWSHF